MGSWVTPFSELFSVVHAAHVEPAALSASGREESSGEGGAGAAFSGAHPRRLPTTQAGATKVTANLRHVTLTVWQPSRDPGPRVEVSPASIICS